jgi:serine/threonine protein phosphatase 1
MKIEGKTFIIGDIHGAYKALIQCLERSGFDYKKDLLIGLGDVADGWNQVYECVEELLKITNRIDIQGNHDHWTLDWMENGFMPEHHRGQGGQATMTSYKDHNYYSIGAHRNFFKMQIKYYKDWKDRVFVHGGFNKDYPLSAGNDVHNYSWNRKLWDQALSAESGKQKLRFIEDISEVFIGHTSLTRWEIDFPKKAAQVYNLDTGAGFDGKLSIMNIDTYEVFQSDNVQKLYPDQKGRN